MFRWPSLGVVLAVTAVTAFAASHPARNPHRAAADYRWSRETDSAAFDSAYNFPVFTVHDEMWAFHPRGAWYSRDGKSWLRSELSPSGLNSGYQKYLLFGDNEGLSYAAQITEIEVLRLQTTFANAVRGLLLHDTFVPAEAGKRLVYIKATP